MSKIKEVFADCPFNQSTPSVKTWAETYIRINLTPPKELEPADQQKSKPILRLILLTNYLPFTPLIGHQHEKNAQFSLIQFSLCDPFPADSK